jgi:hypothetical protein
MRYFVLYVFFLLTGLCYAQTTHQSNLNFVKGSMSIVNQKDFISVEHTLKNYIEDDLKINLNHNLVKVQLLRDKNTSLYALIHIFSHHFFTFHTIRVNFKNNGNNGFNIVSADPNYQIKSEDITNQNKILQTKAGACPQEYNTGNPLFVIVSPYLNNSTNNITNSLNMISDYVNQNKNYQLVKLYNKEVTVQDYKNILACPNLLQMLTISSEDNMGKTFFLDDGLFDAEYFNQIEFDPFNSIFVLNVCNSFRNVEKGFCKTITEMPRHPVIYSAGSTELLIYGSPETYACMWHRFLVEHSAPSPDILNECAKKNDPSFEGYANGIYFIGDIFGDSSGNKATILIQTDQKREFQIEPGAYKIVMLNSKENITSYSININGKKLICSANTDNTISLINNTGLRTGQFYLNHYEAKGNIAESCDYEEVSRSPRRPGQETRDIYGIYPYEKCYQNK